MADTDAHVIPSSLCSDRLLQPLRQELVRENETGILSTSLEAAGEPGLSLYRPSEEVEFESSHSPKAVEFLIDNSYLTLPAEVFGKACMRDSFLSSLVLDYGAHEGSHRAFVKRTADGAFVLEERGNKEGFIAMLSHLKEEMPLRYSTPTTLISAYYSLVRDLDYWCVQPTGIYIPLFVWTDEVWVDELGAMHPMRPEERKMMAPAPDTTGYHENVSPIVAKLVQTQSIPSVLKEYVHSEGDASVQKLEAEDHDKDGTGHSTVEIVNTCCESVDLQNDAPARDQNHEEEAPLSPPQGEIVPGNSGTSSSPENATALVSTRGNPDIQSAPESSVSEALQTEVPGWLNWLPRFGSPSKTPFPLSDSVRPGKECLAADSLQVAGTVVPAVQKPVQSRKEARATQDEGGGASKKSSSVSDVSGQAPASEPSMHRLGRPLASYSADGVFHLLLDRKSGMVLVAFIGCDGDEAVLPHIQYDVRVANGELQRPCLFHLTETDFVLFLTPQTFLEIRLTRPPFPVDDSVAISRLQGLPENGQALAMSDTKSNPQSSSGLFPSLERKQVLRALSRYRVMSCTPKTTAQLPGPSFVCVHPSGRVIVSAWPLAMTATRRRGKLLQNFPILSLACGMKTHTVHQVQFYAWGAVALYDTATFTRPHSAAVGARGWVCTAGTVLVFHEDMAEYIEKRILFYVRETRDSKNPPDFARLRPTVSVSAYLPRHELETQEHTGEHPKAHSSPHALKKSIRLAVAHGGQLISVFSEMDFTIGFQLGCAQRSPRFEWVAGVTSRTTKLIESGFPTKTRYLHNSQMLSYYDVKAGEPTRR
ncbi:hypothetical protein CSUI_005106 [Cystoisospora suis]|uniref:Uncharacterized protein n=1 Tax=Cystoisospora suis TaxID=483139 RepID=A0A2C6KYM8_9APIC|nr:hypothetical protein CSUI_005106 [Cystoisospora suis]